MITQLFTEYDYRCQCMECDRTKFYLHTAKPNEGESTAPITEVVCCNCGWKREMYLTGTRVEGG